MTSSMSAATGDAGRGVFRVERETHHVFADVSPRRDKTCRERLRLRDVECRNGDGMSKRERARGGSNRPAGLADGLEVGFLYRSPSRAELVARRRSGYAPWRGYRAGGSPAAPASGALGVPPNLRLTLVVVK